MAQVVTFDPINLRIVEEDTGLAENEILWAEIYSEWKDWLLADPGARLGYPQAFRQVGSDEISPDKNLGVTFFLMNNWKFRPAEYSHKVKLVGNVFVDGGVGSTNVPTSGTFTVTIESEVSNLTDAVLLQSPAIQQSSFNNEVLVDPNNTTGMAATGTDFPAGTGQQPCLNFVDANTIADARGLNRLRVKGTGITIASVDLSSKSVVGEGSTATQITIEASAMVNSTEFIRLEIEGVFDGQVTIRNCRVGTISMVEGSIFDSGISGTITLTGVANSEFHMIGCHDALAGVGVPTVDFNGDGTTAIIRDYRGGLQLQNKSGPEDVSVDGVIRLVTTSDFQGSGTYIVRGIGRITEDSAATKFDSRDLIDNRKIALQLYDGSIWWDPFGGSAGDVFGENGTKADRTDNIVDLISLVDQIGFADVFLFGGNLTLTSDAPNYNDWIFRGYFGVTFNGQGANGAVFFDCGAKGTMVAGDFIIGRGALFKDLVNANGFLDEGEFDGFLRMPASGATEVSGRYTSNAELEVLFDFNSNSAGKVELYRHTGDIRLENSVAGSIADIYMVGGTVTVGSNCADGSIKVQGLGRIVVEAGVGATVDADGLVSPDTIGTGGSGSGATNQLATYTVQSGSTASVVESDAAEADGYYDRMLAFVEYASGSKIARRVTSYASGAFTLESALPTAPQAGDTIQVTALPQDFPAVVGAGQGA